MAYFIITNSDGDTRVHEVSRESLLRDLDAGEYPECLSAIPDPDTNYWADKVLIIKGEIVTPKPKEVVTKHDLP